MITELYMQVQKESVKKGLSGIQTYDLCDTSAMLYQLRAIKPVGSRPFCEFIIIRRGEKIQLKYTCMKYI